MIAWAAWYLFLALVASLLIYATVVHLLGPAMDATWGVPT